METANYDPIHDVIAGLDQRGFNLSDVRPSSHDCRYIHVHKNGVTRLIVVVLMPLNGGQTRPIAPLELADHFIARQSAGADRTDYVFVSGGEEQVIEWGEVDAP